MGALGLMRFSAASDARNDADAAEDATRRLAEEEREVRARVDELEDATQTAADEFFVLFDQGDVVGAAIATAADVFNRSIEELDAGNVSSAEELLDTEGAAAVAEIDAAIGVGRQALEAAAAAVAVLEGSQ
jgi:hypothetical protein